MLTGWKFWYVRRGDGTMVTQPDGSVRDLADGPILEVTVRFYEMQVVAGQKLLPDGTVAAADAYQYARLDAKDLAHVGPGRAVPDLSGKATLRFTPKDFGDTRDLDDVRLVVNAALAADPVRSPVPEQRLSAQDLVSLDRVKARAGDVVAGAKDLG